MTIDASSYRGYRYASEIISHAVWLHYRFCLSFRDVENLLAERGTTVSYDSIRQWCRKFSHAYVQAAKRCQGRRGDTCYLDEVFVTIQRRRHYLWRSVDQDGDTVDILAQSQRDRRPTV